MLLKATERQTRMLKLLWNLPQSQRHEHKDTDTYRTLSDTQFSQHIRVNCAMGLPKMDTSGACDAYVKVKLDGQKLLSHWQVYRSMHRIGVFRINTQIHRSGFEIEHVWGTCMALTPAYLSDSCTLAQHQSIKVVKY
jgi:hypothetical protein